MAITKQVDQMQKHLNALFSSKSKVQLGRGFGGEPKYKAYNPMKKSATKKTTMQSGMKAMKGKTGAKMMSSKQKAARKKKMMATAADKMFNRSY